MADGDGSDEEGEPFDGVGDGDGCAEICERLTEKRRKERLAGD